jgi:hypothetical protein
MKTSVYQSVTIAPISYGRERHMARFPSQKPRGGALTKLTEVAFVGFVSAGMGMFCLGKFGCPVLISKQS